jgi:hypothetical protein
MNHGSSFENEHVISVLLEQMKSRAIIFYSPHDLNDTAQFVLTDGGVIELNITFLFLLYIAKHMTSFCVDRLSDATHPLDCLNSRCFTLTWMI